MRVKSRKALCRGAIGLAAALIGVLAPTSARAESPVIEAAPDAATIDTVVLQNGTTLHGRITEVAPQSHVVLLTPSGASVKIAWADLQRVLVKSHLPPTYTAGSAAVASAPEPPATGPTARIHIRAPRQVILYRKPAGTNSWSKVCLSPCDEPMPIGDMYKITGNGVAASQEFRLDARPGDTVEVAVDPPSGGGMLIGGMLAYGGAVTAGTGLLVALAGASEHEQDWTNAGLVTAAVGAVAGGLGFAIFMKAGQTDIEQRSPRRSEDAFVRRPTWRTAEVTGKTSGMPSPSFPVLLSGTF